MRFICQVASGALSGTEAVFCGRSVGWQLYRLNRCFKNKVSSAKDVDQLVKWRSASLAAVLPEFSSLSVEYITRSCWEIINEHNVSSPLRLEWQPPPPGSYKLNFDGRALGAPGAAGIGGALKDASETDSSVLETSSADTVF